MILVSLIGLLFIGGVAAWISERFDPRYPRVVALVAMLLAMVLVLALLNGVTVGNQPLASINASWMPRFGISFFLAADGLSGLLLLLTVFLGIVAIGSAWDEITER
ncbi:MAG TPA: NADH-quinone oxidoreductase subunit M, partial [Gammaproteobacteria bacterium]|nr:NADH-quinone oxidoreductase subunit M [Gammaproteobacteria bacterium]